MLESSQLIEVMESKKDFEDSLPNLPQPELKKNLEEQNSELKEDKAELQSGDLALIKISMFSPEPLKFQGKKNHNKRMLKRVIIHFHGGGFICMSSSTHQLYLR
jgi:acetyl esterase/lipase